MKTEASVLRERLTAVPRTGLKADKDFYDDFSVRLVIVVDASAIVAILAGARGRRP